MKGGKLRLWACFNCILWIWEMGGVSEKLKLWTVQAHGVFVPRREIQITIIVNSVREQNVFSSSSSNLEEEKREHNSRGHDFLEIPNVDFLLLLHNTSKFFACPFITTYFDSLIFHYTNITESSSKFLREKIKQTFYLGLIWCSQVWYSFSWQEFNIYIYI